MQDRAMDCTSTVLKGEVQVAPGRGTCENYRLSGLGEASPRSAPRVAATSVCEAGSSLHAHLNPPTKSRSGDEMPTTSYPPRQ